MIILIGGNDKEKSHKILKNIIKQRHIQSLALVLNATKYKSELLENYSDIFGRMKCEVHEIEDPRSERSVEIAKTCQMVFMTGGDQMKLVDEIRDTEFYRCIAKRTDLDEIVLVGTSAGAMAMSSNMIPGDEGEGRDGLETTNFTIDTHFSERRRIHRLLAFMHKERVSKAVGIDEDTCLTIKNHRLENSPLFSTYEVEGSGSCYFISKDKEKFSITIIKDSQFRWD